MKLFLTLLLILTLTIALALTIKYVESSKKYCSGINYYEELSWNGKVLNKYNDSLNHGYRTLLVRAKYGVNKVYFITDTSKVYEIIQAGDSVEKAKDSLAVYIIKSQSRKRYVLKYICN